MHEFICTYVLVNVWCGIDSQFEPLKNHIFDKWHAVVFMSYTYIYKHMCNTILTRFPYYHIVNGRMRLVGLQSGSACIFTSVAFCVLFLNKFFHTNELTLQPSFRSVCASTFFWHKGAGPNSSTSGWQRKKNK